MFVNFAPPRDCGRHRLINRNTLEMIKIRKTEESDIDRVMEIYAIARKYMRDNGNAAQWVGGYPSRELVADDVRRGVGYVGEDTSGEIVMAFAFIIGDDPTYALIEDGKWLDDEPYGTIHRLASSGRHRGILRRCIDFCFTKIGNIRLDTHADNAIMNAAALRLGFTRCGRIYVSDGTPRIAYQRSVSQAL